MRLVVDTHEAKIIDFLRNSNVAFITRQLDTGDFLIEDEETGRAHMLIERKTVNDFASSIKDGRYKDQKLRMQSLKQQDDGLHIMYIIEGRYSFSDDESYYGIKGKAINTAIYKMMFIQNIPVLISATLQNTCAFITSIFERYLNGQFKEWSCKTVLTANQSSQVIFKEEHQEALIKQKRKDNIDSQSCLMHQLSVIPGISYRKACSIKEHFNVSSIAQLIFLLESKENATRKLLNVPGLGPILSTNIADYLFNEST